MPAPTDYNNGMMHAYDHGAIDADRGVVYHRMSNTLDVHRYDVATKAWDSPPLPRRPESAGFGSYENCCDALEYFPELGGLVWIAGDGIAGQNNAHVYLLKDSTREWSVLANDVDLAGTWHSAEYNPAQKVLIFYSAQTNKAYKLDASGRVTPLRTPPFAWYDGSSYASVLSVDLQSGKYLLLTATARELYSYDVGADLWARQPSTNMPDLSNKPVVATPVRGAGVNFYTACKVEGGCQSWLYKPGP
jgi:hypothetical protein